MLIAPREPTRSPAPAWLNQALSAAPTRWGTPRATPQTFCCQLGQTKTTERRGRGRRDRMARYLIRRLLWAVLLFFAVTIVAYILFFVIPADPARQFAGKGATAATIAKAK